MTLSAIYGDLIYCLILSNLASLFMNFVLLSQNHNFPANLSNMVLKKSFLKKMYFTYSLQHLFQGEKQFSQANLSYACSSFGILKNCRRNLFVLFWFQNLFLWVPSCVAQQYIDLVFYTTDGRQLRWERLSGPVKKCGISLPTGRCLMELANATQELIETEYWINSGCLKWD